MFGINPPPSWTEEALCAQVGYPDLWYPEKGGYTGYAKDICSRCPVAARCLSAAFATEAPHERHGVQGATSALERDILTGSKTSRSMTRADIVARLQGIGVDVEAILSQQEAAA